MLYQEDNTFRDIQERSTLDWLDQMAEHEDLAVRGGVKVTREYIASLKKQIRVLEEKNSLKDQFLQKMKKEKNAFYQEKRNV